MLRRNFKTRLAIGCIIAASVSTSGQSASDYSFNTLTASEVQSLLLDVAKSNPKVLQTLRDDPELRKEQVRNLKQLLAFATQAQKEGLTKDPIYNQELENIRREVTAINYDKEITKNRGPMPPFGFITDEQVALFWVKGGSAASLLRAREFENFLETKVALMRSGNPTKSLDEPADEERLQARDFYAKIKIYDSEFNARLAVLPKSLIDRTRLQIKLQQAQFLARAYSEKVAAKFVVADSEVDSYIAAHPEFDLSKKRAKAEQLLSRAKAGEDFAKLADEFSADPGTRGLGGLYQDISKGKMIPQFENAAISLQPGQIYSTVVETDFGYHVIKLEKKNSANDLYDARHILISTDVPDPANPDSADKPLKPFVRSKLVSEKEVRLIEQLIAENNIQVPDDFTIPNASSGATGPVKRRTTPKKPVARKRG